MTQPAPTLVAPPPAPAPGPRRWFRHPGRLLAAAGLLVLTALPLAWGGTFLWAWYHFVQGKSCLEHYHNAEAIVHLRRCLAVWPHDPQTLLLSARSAWREGSFDQARELLDRYQEVCGITGDLVLERALVRGARGDVDRVARYFGERSREGDPAAPLVLEARAEGCLRRFRLKDAEDAIETWLQRQPGNAEAHYDKGRLHEAFEDRLVASKSYARAVELDPGHDAARLRLAVLLVDLAQPSPALPHLEYLRQRLPDNVQVQVYLARCQDQLGNGAEARALLDAVLAKYPHDAMALGDRGNLALNDQQWVKAEEYLSEASRLDPSNGAIANRLYQALMQTGKEEEARKVQEHIKQIDRDLIRFREIVTRDFQQAPHNPDLMCEAGQIALRAGAVEPALTWFEHALRENPNHRATHEALADYYQKIGEITRARRHREQARQAAAAEKKP
jgi:predicted Zn-dependent protease